MRNLEVTRIPDDSTVLRASDVNAIPIRRRARKAVENLLTPISVLTAEPFIMPVTLSPSDYPDFNSLVDIRPEIQMLRRLPLKDEGMRAFYHSLPRETLLRSIQDILLDGDLALAPNNYPSSLPPDVEQRVLWIANPTPQPQIAEFLARCINRLGLTPNETIVYERPKKAPKPLGGTMPNIQHIHVWTPRV